MSGAVPGERSDSLCSLLPLGQFEREAHDKWEADQRDWEWFFVLRSFLRAHYELRGVTALAKPCVERAWLYRHKETKQEKLCPECCHERDVCPSCAINYGLERGLEVLSLFKTLLEPGELLERAPTVKAFAVVFTLPDWVSKHLDGLVGGRDLRGLRRALVELTAAIRDTLTGFYGEGVAAKISWHWWHSPAPLTGPHWHAHVMVPNIRVMGGVSKGVIRRRGKLSGVQLAALKGLWADRVGSCRFIKALGVPVPSELTVNYRFLTRYKGESSLGHRCRYDYRHPMQDLSDSFRRDFPDLGVPGLDWFLDRCTMLQGVQLVRSVGWLANSKAYALGLRCLEPEPDGWEKVSGSVFYFERFDDAGVWVRKVDLFDCGSSYEFFSRSQVRLKPSPRPRRYGWRSSAPVVPA